MTTRTTTRHFNTLAVLCFVSLLAITLLAPRPASASWWVDDNDNDNDNKNTNNNDQDQHTHDHGEHQHTYPGHDDDSDPDATQVMTCGSVIKLKHSNTGFRLHSHQVSYGSGSGQQSVTGVPQTDDTNSLWTLRGAHGKKRCKQGEPLSNGDVIRFQHLNTRLNLHSHNHQSPLSRQQEVSCYGPDGVGDTADNWRIVLAKDGNWMRGDEVEFQHVETSGYLHSHSMTFQHPIPGQQEITVVHRQNANTRWVAEEGIFFPEPSKAQPLVAEALDDITFEDTTAN